MKASELYDNEAVIARATGMNREERMADLNARIDAMVLTRGYHDPMRVTQRRKVYISGPMTSSGVPAENLSKSIAAQRLLMTMGFAPVNPILTYHTDPDATIPWETWMDVDLPWVRCSDAVFRLFGESRGGDVETSEAERWGIPVFRVQADGDEFVRLAADCMKEYFSAKAVAA